MDIETKQLINMEYNYSAHNYQSLPVVVNRGERCYLYDIENKKYFDFLSGYSAVNQGHVHPEILKAFIEQATKLTLCSRAFYTDKFPIFAKYITQLFDYDKVIMMNTGAEAVETALKLARLWGYKSKNIKPLESIFIVVEGCFHGRTLGAISMSSDPSCYNNFGPYLPGIIKIPYNSVRALKKVLKEHGPKVCGFLVEPIQGEAGVVIPKSKYLRKCLHLCKRHNVLFIDDEIQTAYRNGKRLACDWYNIRPDMVILGKALSGGLMPISCVLADDNVMLNLETGTHGSTFGGNPLACATALKAIEVMEKENLADKSNELGNYFLKKLTKLVNKNPKYFKEARGKGLLCALELKPKAPLSAWDICLLWKDKGLLARQTHDKYIRLSPPLVITKEELKIAIKIMNSIFQK